MRIECVFFGPLRERVGKKVVELEVTESGSVEEVVTQLGKQYDGFETAILTQGDLDAAVNITVNGTNIRQLDGLGTKLTDGDLIRFAPSIVGG